MPAILRALPDPSPPSGASRSPADTGGDHHDRDPEAIHVVAWTDPLSEALCYDPRSWYAEQFWLGVIGPTSMWLMRRLAAGLERNPGGFELHVAETAHALGVGTRTGRHSPLRRAVARCTIFELARLAPDDALAVRRRMPPLPRRHLLRLSPALQRLHGEWLEAQRAGRTYEEQSRRARRFALDLLELGEDHEAVVARLIRWRTHPAVAHDAARWAHALHRTWSVPT